MTQCLKCFKFICLENWVEDSHLLHLTGCAYLLFNLGLTTKPIILFLNGISVLCIKFAFLTNMLICFWLKMFPLYFLFFLFCLFYFSIFTFLNLGVNHHCCIGVNIRRLIILWIDANWHWTMACRNWEF